MVFMRAPLLILLALTISCVPQVEGNGDADDLVRKYEEWLKAQSGPPQRGVGTPQSPQDVVFDSDLRAAPERGLSRVHLKNSPEHAYYVYEGQSSRLIDPLFFDGLATVMVSIGRWGYIDESGRFAIEPIFHRANDFDGGVATAQIGDSGWVLLDKSGSMKALDPSVASVRGFSAGLAAFSTGRGRSGYIDRTGAISIPAGFAVARPFCVDGTAAVRVGSRWGIIDVHGGFVVRPEYQEIHCFSEGLAAAKRGKWGFIDKAGTFVVPPQFDGAGDFSEGLASFESGTLQHAVYGFIDRKGSAVVPPKYARIYPFKFGIAKAGTTRTDWRIYPLSYLVPADPYYTSWAYIDRHGKIVATVGRTK